MDSKESDASLEDQETGLNIEEMTAFASKVHQFVYKQLPAYEQHPLSQLLVLLVLSREYGNIIPIE